VLDRVLCPTLVGRDEQIFVLKDALLAAHRGESRLVALGEGAGERLVTSTRVAGWLKEHGLEALPEALELKGFAGSQPAWRVKTTANR
jgi:hypothetical protein